MSVAVGDKVKGGVTVLAENTVGDRFGGLAWSSDGEFLAYTVERGGELWYEVIDLGGSSVLTKPARITPAWIPGEAVDYGPPLMSLRSAWVPNSMTAMLFILDDPTPRVSSIDLSGILP